MPQGAPYVQGFNAIGGSAGASYNASFAAAGDTLHATVGPATTSGNFPTSDVPNGSGIATNEHVGPEALSTSCTTPIDSYTMTATLNSNNLCSGSGPVVNDYLATGTDHFNVTAGLNLNSQTVVVAEFPSQSGPEYGVDQCFNSTGTKKISNDPGSVHVAEIVTSAGTCTDVDTLKGVTLTLTIPAGFSFTTGGHSPPAHVFVFDAAGSGFDLHYPPNEVTTAVHQTVSGNTVTLDLSSVDLSSVDVGLRLGAGNIPSTYTIYARAKTSYTGTSAPAGDTAFKFSTTASSGSDNAGQLFASSDSGPYYIVANPTQDPVNHSTASCVGGVITPK